MGTAARSIETVKDYDIVVAKGMTGRAIAKSYPELNLIYLNEPRKRPRENVIFYPDFVQNWSLD